MRRLSVLVGLAAALAMVGSTLAAEPGAKKKRKVKRETGTFVSAALEGNKIQWKLTMDNGEEGVEKTFEMRSVVIVMYRERKGRTVGMAIRMKGKKAPKAKGKRKLFTGSFVKAEAAEGKVEISVNGADVVEEGAEAPEAAEKSFVFNSKMTVVSREARGRTIATMIMGARKKRKPKDEGGEKPEKKRRRKKKKGGEGAPDNI